MYAHTDDTRHGLNNVKSIEGVRFRSKTESELSIAEGV